MPDYGVKDENGKLVAKITSDTPPTPQMIQQALASLPVKGTVKPTPNPAQELVNNPSAVDKTLAVGRDALELVGETSTGVQRSVTSLADFLATPVRAAAAYGEAALGSERSAEELFFDKYSLRRKVPEKGAFAGEGILTDIAGGTGELTGLVATGGPMQRLAAQAVSKALQAGPSTARNVFELLGSGKSMDDIVFGIQAGLGGEVAAGVAPEGFEEVARIAGQVMTPAMIQASMNAAITFGRNTLMKDATPNTQALQGASSHIYNQLDELGVRLTGNDQIQIRNKLSTFLKDPNKITNDVIYNPLRTRLKRLDQQIQSGRATFSEINTVRTELRKQGSGVDQAALAAREAADILDSSIAAMRGDAKGVLIDGKNVQEAIAQAGDLWRRSKASGLLDDLFTNAQSKVQAARGQGKAPPYEYQLRQDLESMLRDPNKARSFTAENRKVMSEFIKGGTLENTLGQLGTTLGSSSKALVLGALTSIPTALYYGAGSSIPFALAAGGAVTAAVTITGAARTISTNLLKNNAQLMKRLVNQGDDALGITKDYMATTAMKDRDPRVLAVLLKENNADMSRVLGSAFGNSKLGSDMMGFYGLLSQGLQEEAAKEQAMLRSQMPN